MLKKFVSSLNSSFASTLMSLRDTESLFKIPAYLFLPRDFAKSLSRFRINYGPDTVSLQKRGLLRGSSSICRLCNKEEETRQHLLCSCSFTQKRIPLSWKDKNLAFYISDKIHEDEDFYRKVAHLRAIADALELAWCPSTYHYFHSLHFFFICLFH